MPSKVLIYPLLKKADYQINATPESVAPTDEELISLTDFYMAEIIKNMKNHGFKMNTELLRDMTVTSDFLKSAIFRNVGKYHHLQDAVDNLEVSENDPTQTPPTPSK
jgi:hypothetical protein